MTRELRSSLSVLRRQLENPYAYAEFLDSAAEDVVVARTIAKHKSSPATTQSAALHPYARIQDCDEGNADSRTEGSNQARNLVTPRAAPAPMATATGRWQRRSDAAISRMARMVLERLWNQRSSLWDGAPPVDPVEMLDPEIALGLQGIRVNYVDGLGKTRSGTQLFEVAGVFDVQSNAVRISAQSKNTVQLFTLAHELGHALMHPNMAGLHRDIAVDQASGRRDPLEREADRFATFFLMPEKLVSARFESIFGEAPLRMSEEVHFELFGAGSHFDPTRPVNAREVARKIAGTDRFAGRQHIPLAQQFRVSVEAMAIRIEELGLLAVPR